MIDTGIDDTHSKIHTDLLMISCINDYYTQYTQTVNVITTST